MVNHKPSDAPPKTAPKHLVIVQLTRAGDIVQTYQAVKEVRTERPDLRLTLLARKHFAVQVAFLFGDVFDQVVTLDAPKLFSGALANSHLLLKETLNSIQKCPVEAIVHLSYCKPSQ